HERSHDHPSSFPDPQRTGVPVEVIGHQGRSPRRPRSWSGGRRHVLPAGAGGSDAVWAEPVRGRWSPCRPERRGGTAAPPRACDRVLERVTGIEPALSAWEADVLPLNYTRGQLMIPPPALTAGHHVVR